MINNKITISNLERVDELPLILNVDNKGLTSQKWAEKNCSEVQTLVQKNGALLIRGLRIYGSNQFGRILNTFFGKKLLDYNYRSTPRTEMRRGIYTATEYPSSEIIPQHNESSYAKTWPTKIGFMCIQPPQTGGETPIGDNRFVHYSLPKKIRDKFESKGIMYVRNYSDIDIPWSEVFQTTNKKSVELFCVTNDIHFEWLEGNRLRTKQVNPAIIRHPWSEEKIWFNQAHLFHISSLPKDIENNLVELVGEDSLPRNTYYGDGSPIENETLNIIRNEYNKNKKKFSWQKDDILLLDNLWYTHGRESYTGSRKIITGMA